MLINDIDKLKAVIPTVYGNEFSRYEPFMAEADEYLVNELIGSQLYQAVQITAGTFTPPHGGAPIPVTADATLTKLCTSVSALKGYLIGIPFLDLVETETGFAVVSDVGNNVVPASKDRVEKLIAGIKDRLSDAIEKLLEYLEESTTSIKESWRLCKSYIYTHDSYIFTLKEFRRYAKYAGSRLEWINELPVLTKAIRMKIEPLISAEQSAAVITQLKAGTLTNANKKIIEDLRFSLAAFVTADEKTGLECALRARATMINDVDNYAEFKASSIYVKYLAKTNTDVNSLSIADFGI